MGASAASIVATCAATLLVSGAVPGKPGCYVVIRPAKKVKKINPEAIKEAAKQAAKKAAKKSK